VRASEVIEPVIFLRDLDFDGGQAYRAHPRNDTPSK
jgi:hypothetical protein